MTGKDFFPVIDTLELLPFCHHSIRYAVTLLMPSTNAVTHRSHSDTSFAED